MLMVDFDVDKGTYEIAAFGFKHMQSLLWSLSLSRGNPQGTKLAIQVIASLMRIHKDLRGHYARDPLFVEWRQDSKNMLYSNTSVQGILLVSQDTSTDDIFATEIQQFIYYIGEKNWPLNNLSPRVQDRFNRIWEVDSETKPVLPFPDPGERWFTDRDDSDDEDNDEDESFQEYLASLGGDLNVLGTNGTTDTAGEFDLLSEPDTPTEEELRDYIQATEEAGLRSQDRRRGTGRRGERNLEEEREIIREIMRTQFPDRYGSSGGGGVEE
jgi:hypothetical protein